MVKVRPVGRMSLEPCNGRQEDTVVQNSFSWHKIIIFQTTTLERLCGKGSTLHKLVQTSKNAEFVQYFHVESSNKYISISIK